MANPSYLKQKGMARVYYPFEDNQIRLEIYP
nr:MAG TPA: hypothetical protein [Caudoviricetes sp.]